MRNARGAATVELALGMLLLIPTLMAGLYFGELFHLSLKVHEAAASTAWDATAYRVERPGPNGVDPNAWYDSNRIARPRAEANGQQRYEGWDGRTSRVGVAAPRQVYTHAEPMTVRCTVGGGGAAGFPVQATAVTPAYADPGLLNCGAEGIVNMVDVPASYYERGQGGWFTENILPGLPMRLCAFGRPVGGRCEGALPLMLGDHGFTSGNGENAECARQSTDPGVLGGSCANPTFYRLTHENWDRSRPWSSIPDDFARRVTGRAPTGKVTGFYMSFRGEESAFGEIDTRNWQASPMDFAPGGTYRTAYSDRYARAAGGLPFLYAGRYRCD